MTATVIHREDRDTGNSLVADRQFDDYGRRQRAIPVTTRETVKHGLRDNGRPFLVSSTANHYKGFSHTGKKFSRWATDYVTVIDVLDGGALFSRGKAPRTGWNSHLMFAETPRTGSLLNYLHLLGDDPASVWDYYPTLSHYVEQRSFERHLQHAWGPGTPVWGGNSEFRRRFVGARDAHELTRSLFGATRVRRDLVKAVGGANIQNIYAAWQFRGLVPVDWLVSMMRDGFGDNLPAIYDNSQHATPFRAQIRALDLQSLRNLTRDPLPKGWIMRDLVRMHPDVSPRRVRGWSDLHDALDEYRRTFGPVQAKNAKPKRPIKLRPEVEALEGTTVGGLNIEIARHEQDLWNWGLEMSHCIGGYGPQMRSRESILGAVRDSAGTMIGNFEIGVRFFQQAEDEEPTETWTLNQLLGKHNSSLPDAARTEMETHLKCHGVTCGRYWGAAERPAPQQQIAPPPIPVAAQVAQAMHADGFGPGEWEVAGDDLDDDFLNGMAAFEEDLLGQQQPVGALPF